VAWCRAADDFAAIRARMDELRRQRNEAGVERIMPSADGRTINVQMTEDRRRVEELIKAVRARRTQERRQ
jgi:hypothetical protein